MAPWDVNKFSLFEESVTATLEGKRPTLDVGFYIYLYDPVEEVLALEEFSNLVMRLKRKGYSAEVIWLSDMVVDILKHLRFLEAKAVEIEKSDRETVRRDLERVLPMELASGLREKLGGKGVEHCAVLLRCGSLFPFVHVSSLLSSLEGMVECTLVIPYPGDREGRMLNEGRESVKNYYRAKVI